MDRRRRLFASEQHSSARLAGKRLIWEASVDCQLEKQISERKACARSPASRFYKGHAGPRDAKASCHIETGVLYRKSMQSVIFLAFQHDRIKMEKSASRCQSKEEKKGKMKRTILKDWKARLNYFLQNSSNSTNAKANKRGQQKTCFRPSPEEAQLWSETFDELLGNKYGLAAFRAFLKSEFCEENIDFWLACEDYKKIKSPQKLTAKAKKIYNDFIEKEAPKEINIDFQTKSSIAQSIEEATDTCFSAAQKRVYSLMENNSYPRFLESEFYQELCRKSPISRDPQGT